MSFYARNLQVSGDGDVALGQMTPSDVGCRLTKYMVLFEADTSLSTATQHQLDGHENKAFDPELGNDDTSRKPNLTQEQNTIKPSLENNNEIDTCTELTSTDTNVEDGTSVLQKQGGCYCVTQCGYAGCKWAGAPLARESNSKLPGIRRSFSQGDVKTARYQSPVPALQDDVEGRTARDQGCQRCREGLLSPKFSLASNDEDQYSDWRMSLDQFTSKRLGEKRKSSGLSRELRSYYKKQDNLVGELEELREETLKDERSYYKSQVTLINHYEDLCVDSDDAKVETFANITKSIFQCQVSYYKSQDTLINQFEELRVDSDDAKVETVAIVNKLRKKASLFAKITFVANLMLLAIKVVAVVMSGSISLISSLVDSCVDLVSGVVIWACTRAVKKTDRYVYPQGRTKLEPIAIVILSAVMSFASMQIIKESVTKVLGLSSGSQSPPVMDWITIGIASVTVVVKLVLFVLCYRIKHPTVQALAQDHRNDVISNAAAILFGYIGSQQMQEKTSVKGLIYLDPTGAIVISVYIIVMWIITGWDQIKLLVGHTATPEFLSKVTWICMDHHRDIQKVDTVRAFHFGNHFLVEADIVLPPEMTLREAHDIGQPLQQKLERLPTVERAFVHIDYEAVHDPKTEHKVV